MRSIFILGLSLFMVLTSVLLVTPSVSYADNVDDAVSTVKENPGKSAGVAGCGVFVAFFPPAAILCGVAIVAGVVVDEIE